MTGSLDGDEHGQTGPPTTSERQAPHVSDQSTPEPSAQPPAGNKQVQVIVPDDAKHGEYANFLVVSHSPHEFTLDFCQLQPSGEPGKVNAEVVSRVRIAPTMVGRVLNALNTNLSNYEDRFGQVKALG